MRKVLLVLLATVVLVAMASPVFAKPSSTVNRSGEILTQEQIDKANAEAAAEYTKIPKAQLDASPLPPGTITPKEVYPGESRFLDVPLHRQLETYWCGPASLLEIIDDYGRAGNVAGSTEYQKQQTLANQSGTQNPAGSNTYSLKQTLNGYVGDVYTYNVDRIAEWTTPNYNKFWNICYNRIITLGRPICVLVNTSYLPYYSGRVSYHYIVVDGMTVWYNDYSGQVETSISTIRVADPHFQDPYFGQHTVLWTDLLNAVVGYFIPPEGCQYYNLIF